MKKTLFFGLMAAALGFAACSEENEAILTENAQTGMILNATVSAGIDTRAIIDNSDEIWPFNFTSGDKVLVSNPTLSEGEFYEFTNDLHHFSCTVAQPASSPVIWTARYPNHSVNLTNQTGKLEDVAQNYALVGSTSSATTGASGLNIDMEAKVAILKIINGGGVLELSMKNSSSTWVTGLSADDFSLTTSTTAAKLFETTEAGVYYVVVPAGIQLSIKDGSSISLKSTSVDGFTAGKYYTMTVNGASWVWAITLGKDEAETVKVQVGVSKPTSGFNDLNSAGDVWEVYDPATKTNYIQSNRLLVKARDGGRLFSNYKKLKKVENLNLIDWTNVSDFHQLFLDCESLEEFDFKDIYTESATDMSQMFDGCKSLTKVDFANINTKTVENMAAMFSSCESMEELDLTKFITSKVTNMGGMFLNCKSLTKIKGLETFITSNVEDMNGMFMLCESMEELDLTSFDTENATDMSDMFRSCKSLTKIKGLETFDTSNVENMCGMFANCDSFTELDLSSFTTSKVTDMSQMFDDSKLLTKIKGLTNFNTSNVETMKHMFNKCESLKDLDLSSFNTEKVTTFYYMFSNCVSLETVDFSNINTSSATNLVNMFDSDEKLASLTLSNNFMFVGGASGSYCVFHLIGSTENKCKIYGASDALKAAVTTAPYQYSVGWNDSTMEFGD